jgi:hypothetical protein
MANQPEVGTYDAGVYQLQLTDPVQGGTGGVSNAALLNLANRTGWLYNQIGILAAEIAVLAPINSPNFTGTPTAPNVASGDQSTKISNTNFVANAVGGVASVNVAGSINVALTQAQWGCGVIVLTGVLTGNISVIFPTQVGKWVVSNQTTGINPNTNLGYIVTCKTAGAGGWTVYQGYAHVLFCDGTKIFPVNDASRTSNLGSIAPASFSSSGAYVDPQPSATRDAKFGQSGIAVRGGAYIDSLTLGGAAGLQTGVFSQRVSITASQNFQVPANVFYVKAIVTAGGGVGGACSSSVAGAAGFSGGGGGAGGSAFKILAVMPGQIIPITVGAGGQLNVNGGYGGTSAFLTLNSTGGGPGGAGGLANAGGMPGNSTGGDIYCPGGWGSDGQDGAIVMAGNGGASYWGGGGRAGTGRGVDGQAFGSGGGGAYSTPGPPGNGQQGVVVLEY